ncbi:MAG: hypothetical protein M9887_11080 [Chitinophagales bacterium]|nr:hypothetical protein [Chitinophagales bacterium]
MKIKWGLYFILTFCLLEITARLYFNFTWGTPFFAQDEMIYHFYPELKEVRQRYFDDKTPPIKVLILGGSAVTDHLYCDIDFELRNICRKNGIDERKVSVFSLARSGQTSFDSRRKREQLSDLKFDYTFIYDGFNDCRANNIPRENFDIDYRHFTFYYQVMLYEDYIKNHISILPFTFHFIWHSVKEKIVKTPHVPPYYAVMKDKVLNASYWDEGKEIKTVASFSRNLNEIYKVQKEIAGQKLILSTYAYYSPPDYSLERFYKKELDYQEQKWPTEIYGDARYIPDCVKAHNEILKSWKDSSNVYFVDLNSIIPKNKIYFNDICHLTDNGCAIMAQNIFDIIFSTQ